MRKASQSYGIIIDEDKFVGFALGYDYCSEHEWGTKELRRLCGMPESSKKNMGVANRKITKCPPFFFKEETHKKKKFAILYTGKPWQKSEELEKYLPSDFTNWTESLTWNEKWNSEHPSKETKDNISTAWDEEGFGIAVMGEKEVEYLKELKEALENLNVVIAIADFRARNPFAGSCLCVLIADRVPKDVTDMMFAGDKEYFDRVDYEEKIGMTKIIAKHGNKNGYNGLHYFMACSPKWIDYEDVEHREKRKKEMNTKYDIMYWINYSDDDDNHGWYSVEEIREWLTGKKHLVEIRKK